MKRILLLFALMFSINLFAQDSHLNFKGITIDGNLSDFVVNMESKGFTFKYNTGNGCMLTGSFLNEDVEINVCVTAKTKVVYQVAIFFPEKSSWNSLECQYSEYKEIYTKKYGKPAFVEEIFETPYYLGDGYELQALYKDKCRYLSFFDIKSGAIGLKMTSFSSIFIAYTDSINSEINNMEEEQLNFEDI